MADGTTQTGQAGGQSSSQSGSQQSSTTAGAQGGASQQTTSSQDTTGQQTSGQQTNSQQAPTRPAYVPEQFFDATAGTVKEKEFGEFINSQTARIAADESRRLALPQTPEAYKVALPADFKVPDGIEFKFNDADPLLAQAREVMHAVDQGKLSGQEAFSKFLGLYAGAQVSTAAEVQAAKTAEIGKLGPTGPALVGAITTFLKATLGDAEGAQIASRMFTAADVQIMQKLVGKFASQGAAGFSQQHRDVTAVGKVDQAAYDKMTYSEKKEYAAKHSQAA